MLSKSKTRVKGQRKNTEENAYPAPTLSRPPLLENGINLRPLVTSSASPPSLSLPSPSLPSFLYFLHFSILPPLSTLAMGIPPSLAPVGLLYPPLSAMSPTAPEVSYPPTNSPPPLEEAIPSPASLVSPISPLLPKPPIPSLISSPPPPLTKILIPPITSPPPLFNELPYPSLDSPPPPPDVTSLPRDPPPPRSPPMSHPPPVGQMTSNISIGLIVGVSVGCVLLFAVFGVFCFCCMKKRKRENKPVDHYRPPVVANNIYYEALPPQKQKKFGSKRDFIITVMPNRCLDPPLIGSNGDSNSNDSGSDNTFSPQGPGIALGYSRSIFTYEELAVATNGFSEANLLGQGGFGYVHKGILPNGREIAVKKLKTGSSQGDREFQAEVETISRVHHKHLVTLVGYCCTEGERLLVYEFVPNNTLEFHLHDKEQAVMNWPTRLKIAIGSAKGLAYLHEDCNPTIIHRDIKSSNILIDHNLEAKVSDFGLAKFFSDTNRLITHISTRVVGTFGYLAPEYANCGKVTDKSDVFSYGVVLLELMTGRVPINTTESCTYQSLYEWARPLLKQALEERNFDALVDPRLQKTYKLNEMASMAACAAACVRHSAWLRPRMSQIVRVLEGDVSLSVLNEGTRPGDSATNGPNGGLNIDLNYLEDMHNWSTREFGARDSSEIASDHGLNPSGSTTNDNPYNTRKTK